MVRPFRPLGSDGESRERLAADRQLVERLRAERFRGPHWEAFCTVLWQYAVPVLNVWIRLGAIFQRCREVGIRIRDGGPLHGQPLTDGELEELVATTVAAALLSFRKVLEQGRWSPDGGANLTTFFMRQCLFQFPNAYRALLQERARSNRFVEWDEQRYQNNPVSDGGTDKNVNAKEILDSIPDSRTRKIVRLRAMGYSHAEIGEMLHMTARAVESALYRCRRRLREGGEV